MKGKNKREKLLQTLITKLTQVIKKMHRGKNFPFGNFVLSRQQVMILFFIAEKKEGEAVKDLAKFLRVTPGAITQFIDILVTYKLVQRKTDIHDHRLIRIKLSPKARIKFKKFKTDYFNSISSAFKTFQTKELQEFIKLIKKIKI